MPLQVDSTKFFEIVLGTLANLEDGREMVAFGRGEKKRRGIKAVTDVGEGDCYRFGKKR